MKRAPFRVLGPENDFFKTMKTRSDAAYQSRYQLRLPIFKPPPDKMLVRLRRQDEDNKSATELSLDVPSEGYVEILVGRLCESLGLGSASLVDGGEVAETIKTIVNRYRERLARKMEECPFIPVGIERFSFGEIEAWEESLSQDEEDGLTCLSLLATRIQLIKMHVLHVRDYEHEHIDRVEISDTAHPDLVLAVPEKFDMVSEAVGVMAIGRDKDYFHGGDGVQVLMTPFIGLPFPNVEVVEGSFLIGGDLQVSFTPG